MQQGEWISVSLGTQVENESEVPRVLEAMGRVAGGLALDGITCNITVMKMTEDGD